MKTTWDVDKVRARFPALGLHTDGLAAVYFDGPAGSQVPQSVVQAMGEYLVRHNANHGGMFATSRASDALLDESRLAMADFLGAADPDCVVFGANMTTLTFSFSRAIAKTWKAGDEIIVTSLDHDANVTPWVLAARDAGATVKQVGIRVDGTLDLDDLKAKLSPKTRLAAIGCASNALGTANPVEEIVQMVHASDALVYLDAVHWAPHRLVDVARWDCDFLACSAYKFFGPHVGVLWGKRHHLDSLTPYKVRPASDALPDRWMTGTQSHEGIAGVLAAVEYLADLGRELDPQVPHRRAALETAWSAIAAHEQQLTRSLLAGLAQRPSVKLWGIDDPARLTERVATFAITHNRLRPRDLAEYLDSRGIYVWHGNFYALPLTEAWGLEPDGLVRIGLLHYNTQQEIDRLLLALDELE